MPSTTEEWLKMSRKYEAQSNVPQCIGTLASKHCLVQAMDNSGRRSTVSIVFLGLVDADYCFLFADIESQGATFDEEGARNAYLCEKLQQKLIQIPTECALSGRKDVVPYVFIADHIFPLQQKQQQQKLHILTPYSDRHHKGSTKRVFNNRLSKANRVKANAFGILSRVFRVLRKPLLLNADKARYVVLACVYLHNFLLKSDSSKSLYAPSGTFDCDEQGGLVEGSWRKDAGELTSFLSMKKADRKFMVRCDVIRKEFAEYFVTDQGIVS